MKKIVPYLKSPALLLIIPWVIFMAFGLHHLTKFETADEHYWLYSNTSNNKYWVYDNGRIQQYWSGLLSGNWKKTRINDKPGVTLAYVSGAGEFLRQNLEERISSGEIAPPSKTIKAEKINLYFRLPILIFCGLFSLIFYYLIKKLTKNRWIALFSAAGILLSPILLGMSQIVNPDALLWVFVFATILTFQVYLNEGLKKYAWWAMLFFGLAMLTKYSSLILFPFLFVMILIQLMYHFDSWPTEVLAEKIFKYCRTYVLIAVGALLLFALLLPDSFVEPNNFLKTTIGFAGMPTTLEIIGILIMLMMADAIFNAAKIVSKIFSVIAPFLKTWFPRAVYFILAFCAVIIVINAWLPKDVLDLHRLPFDYSKMNIFRENGIFHLFLLEYLPLVFSLTPLVLVFAVGLWIKSLWKKSDHDQIVFTLSLFIVAFYFANIVQHLRLDIRYSIMLYPMVVLLFAIAVSELLSLEKRSYRMIIAAFGIFVMLSTLSIWQVKPFFFNYSNDLLPQKYLVADGWGYGGYEAAQYLNSLPNAANLNVWSDYNGVCLFFEGKCAANAITFESKQKKAGHAVAYDYLVTSRRGAILASRLWLDINEDYETNTVKELLINGKPGNFVKVLKTNL